MWHDLGSLQPPSPGFYSPTSASQSAGITGVSHRARPSRRDSKLRSHSGMEESAFRRVNCNVVKEAIYRTGVFDEQDELRISSFAVLKMSLLGIP